MQRGTDFGNQTGGRGVRESPKTGDAFAADDAGRDPVYGLAVRIGGYPRRHFLPERISPQ